MSAADRLKRKLQNSVSVEQRAVQQSPLLTAAAEPTPQPMAEQPAELTPAISLSSDYAVRISVSLPSSEQQQIQEMIDQCLSPGLNPGTSQICRAGLRLLAQLSIEDLRDAVRAVPVVKPGIKTA